MLISEFDYELPAELIAQEPLERRERSRMLAVNRRSGDFSDLEFSNFPEFLEAGDVLVLNNTKVFPARLFGETETGARVEIFLVREIERDTWETLARPAKRLRVGKTISFGIHLSGKVLEKAESGTVKIAFEADGDFETVLDETGTTPLPPYIKRERGNSNADRERYQTVFASRRGAIAAPTAGLHFTGQILDEIRKRGVHIKEITLHVGYGTFEPVRAEDLTNHTVMPEQCEISEEAAEVLNGAKARGNRIVAVGTTTTRALESFTDNDGKVKSEKKLAGLTITPGYKFRIVDALLTNFHLPQSSLLVLTSTFGGHELIMNAYRHAVESQYRFYSYGDCMLIF
jgi:S-adenosylmethionine:tRNA ribosyltransferase-isomerase